MGAGKSSLVLRFVKGQFLEFQVRWLWLFRVSSFDFFTFLMLGFEWLNFWVFDDFGCLDYRNLRSGRRFFRKRWQWMTPLWNLRYGILRVRRGIIVWLLCIIEVLLLRLSSMISLARYDHLLRVFYVFWILILLFRIVVRYSSYLIWIMFEFVIGLLFTG